MLENGTKVTVTSTQDTGRILALDESKTIALVELDNNIYSQEQFSIKDLVEIKQAHTPLNLLTFKKF